MTGPGSDPRDPSTSGSSPTPDHRGRTAVIVLLSVLAAVLIAVIIWLVATRNPAPAPTPSATPSATSTSSPRPTSTSTAFPAVSRCTVSQLTVTLGAPNGSAGAAVYPIIFTNKGTTPCELHGYPGVSLVGDGNGTQLGAAADEDPNVAIVQNTLAPGSAVQASVKVDVAQNFANCTVVPADGFRVYPPHSTAAVFVQANGISGCSNADVHLMTVQPVVPAS